MILSGLRDMRIERGCIFCCCCLSFPEAISREKHSLPANANRSSPRLCWYRSRASWFGSSSSWSRSRKISKSPAVHQNPEPAEPLRSLLRLLTDVYMKIRESGTSPWRWQQRPSPAQPAVVVGPETFLQQQEKSFSSGSASSEGAQQGTDHLH